MPVPEFPDIRARVDFSDLASCCLCFATISPGAQGSGNTVCQLSAHLRMRSTPVSTRRAGQYKVCQLANGGNTRCGPLPGPCHCLHCTDVTRGSHQLVTRLVSTLSLALLPQLPVTRARTMGSAWRVSVCVSLGSLPTLSTQYTLSTTCLLRRK